MKTVTFKLLGLQYDVIRDGDIVDPEEEPLDGEYVPAAEAERFERERDDALKKQCPDIAEHYAYQHMATRALRAEQQRDEALESLAEWQSMAKDHAENSANATTRILELEGDLKEALSCLEGVIAEADRETVPFIRARALLARAGRTNAS